jgi:hypothetical protein
VELTGTLVDTPRREDDDRQVTSTQVGGRTRVTIGRSGDDFADMPRSGMIVATLRVEAFEHVGTRCPADR